MNGSAEHKRQWRKWGPYLSERSWGTVRENYSDTDAWEGFPFNHARSRAYRWTEDGIGGFCNDQQTLCLALALWNGRDPILKERFFGLNNHEGNHGEDIKEYYYYLDGTPTHSYMKMLYKYPQVAFPYEQLVEENTRRGPDQPEYELIDALRDAFDEGRYFDVFIEYAHAGPDDILYRITAINRGPEAAEIHLLPQLWYRNTWAWDQAAEKPSIALRQNEQAIYSHDSVLGERWLYMTSRQATPTYLFTDNETNFQDLFGTPNSSAYVKDGIDKAIIAKQTEAVNDSEQGTKCAGHFQTILDAGQSITVQARFADRQHAQPFADFDDIFNQRIAEADEFYRAIQRPTLSDDERSIQRQGFAGLLWTQQFYHFDVGEWMKGAAESDRTKPLEGWEHLHAEDIISIPANWEYPWFAAWDLCFQAMTLAYVDPESCHKQLLILLQDSYMKPDGEIPAHEAAFSDTNPPLHAWAAWRVYQVQRMLYGRDDREFLTTIYPKLKQHFDWWLKAKDPNRDHVFAGGFLGLDNIAPFDRSNPPLPDGATLDQADATGWMALFSLNMLAISVELAQTDPACEADALHYLDEFLNIAKALFAAGDDGISLWDETDGFFYDVIRCPNGEAIPLRVRSFVGLVPFLAALSIDTEVLGKLPQLRKRLFAAKDQPDIADHGLIQANGDTSVGLVILNPQRLARVMERLTSSHQFLSPYGIRSVSKAHRAHPFSIHLNGETYTLGYEPGEGKSEMMGGNSNWRGPIWAPINRLIIEALYNYDRIYEGTTVEFPAESGDQVTFRQFAEIVCDRLVQIMVRNEDGERPHLSGEALFNHDPHWRDYVMFPEYFHGESGAGLGALRQNGWTALIAELIHNGGRLADGSVS